MLSPSRLPGAVFDRQASIRRSLINTDTVSRRPKKVKRRKTISGLPDNINQELGMNHRGAICCPLLSTDLYQHSGRASFLLSLLPINLLSMDPFFWSYIPVQKLAALVFLALRGRKQHMQVHSVGSRPCSCFSSTHQVSSFALLHPVKLYPQ